MKRTELIPGQDYLVARGNDWQEHGGIRHRVLNISDNLVPPNRFRSARDEDYIDVAAVTEPDGKPTTVKVCAVPAIRSTHFNVVAARVEPDGSLARAVLVPTREVRGTWEHASKIVAECEAARKSARQRVQERQKAQQRRVWGIANRLDTIVDRAVVERVSRQGGWRGEVTITLDDLEAILDGAKVTDEPTQD